MKCEHEPHCFSKPWPSRLLHGEEMLLCADQKEKRNWCRLLSTSSESLFLFHFSCGIACSEINLHIFQLLILNLVGKQSEVS